MITKNKHTASGQQLTDRDRAQFESIDAWLAVFVRLLPLRDEDRDEIAGELEGHLRERVRDLMVAGHDESDAVQTAVSELGNTAELATRFGKAHSYPRRRRFMHAAIATAAVGVIGIGAFTMVSPQPGVNFSVFEEKQASSEMQAVLDRTIDARFEGTAFGEVVTYLAESLDENFVINMHDMEDHGLTPADTQIHLRLSNVRVGKVLDLLEEQVNDGSRYLVWNVGDDVIEFGDRERFDRRTSELVSYDIAPVLLNMWEEYDIEYEEARSQIGDVLVSMVSPDDWHDMGGGLAHMNFVGGKIFVEAPKRMHKQIAWILSELADGDQTASTITGPFGPGTGGGFGTGALPPNSATIQPGDVLRIEVFELMQAGEMYAAVQSVGAEQEVRLPNVGGVSTAGKSLGQLERDVRDRLRDVLRDPVVAVFRQSGSMMTGLAGGGAGHASNPLTTTGTGAGGHGGSGGSTLSTGAVGPRAGAGAPGLGGGAGGAGGAGGVATPDRE